MALFGLLLTSLNRVGVTGNTALIVAGVGALLLSTQVMELITQWWILASGLPVSGTVLVIIGFIAVGLICGVIGFLLGRHGGNGLNIFRSF